MAPSGVSMAILRTEMKRGDPRLSLGQIYISSRAVEAPPFLLQDNGLWVSNPPSPKHTALCAASSHNLSPAELS